MRTPVLFASLIVLGTAAEARETHPVIPAHCRAPGADIVASPRVLAGPRPLNEMPDAAVLLAVYREVDRCPIPVVLRGEITPAPAPVIRR